MVKLLNIVGARPQIIKAAALSRAVKKYYAHQIEDIIVHTGQHYDYNMSQVFFEELEIPKPHINMGVGSGSHATQTAQIMLKTEEIIQSEKPDIVVVYGDTNSTLAVAITAAKMHYPVAHIEAGLRSFNKTMPEEINRITCDHVSTLLFAPTQTAINNLKNEGFKLTQTTFDIDHPAILKSGDIMYDNALYFSNKATKLAFLDKIKGEFALVTIHREQNTDNIDNLKQIASLLVQIADEQQINIVFPIHPRTVKALLQHLPEMKARLDTHPLIHLIEPVSYLEILALLKSCKIVMTDSGGLQKEAYFMQKPCIILRTETEWVEIVEQGAGRVTDINPIKVKEAVQYFIQHADDLKYAPVFGDGHAAEFICKNILNYLNE
ncbi:MAG: UDP-N-acetylglucosamine 2-epimerase (non-hydrolyzing) [Bacteroidales bacterium]|nr:UDP-N-acetylglucosamine 2-epimerase (non-hydrolyzing) [Bacteroidales bacterium]